ncbi:TPA: TetR/AcrR family transcriptional regulator [bacterium]|nr:TetR/AcrR family transcriptional regulator [bacterium]
MQELSRREREKLNRYNEILNAARKVFAEKGYEVATMDDVASAAELSKGTIYLYFQNKSDLFASTLEMAMEQVAYLIAESISKNPDDFILGIKDIIQQQLLFCEKNMDLFKILASDSFHIEIHSHMGKNKESKLRLEKTMYENMKLLADYIQLGIDRNVFKNVNPIDAAFALLSLIQGFVFGWIMHPEDTRLKDKTEIVTTIFLDGLRSTDFLES